MTDYSPNLNIPHLDPNSASPEVPVDEAIDALDAKITAPVTVPFSGNTVTLTQDRQAGGSIFHLTVGSPGPSGACTLNFAAFGVGNFSVINETGKDVTIQISGQAATPPVLLSGQTAGFLCDGVNVRAQASTAGAVAAIGFLIDGGGATITTGMKGYIEVPFACTINRNTLLGDQSGSIVVNIWKCTYSQFDAGSTHPVVGDKITASAPPTISTATKSQDSTLTGWTTAVAAGDILAFNVDSVTTMQRVTLSLKVTKT